MLVAARHEQRLLIENLIQLYLYDMTSFMPFPVGLDGRFEYDFLDRFWRHPYLIMVGDEIAGFALVVDECPLTGRQPFLYLRRIGGVGLPGRRWVPHWRGIPATGTLPYRWPTRPLWPSGHQCSTPENLLSAS